MKRYCLRTVLCISIALSLLITSIHLPVRQAEAFVKPAMKVAAPMVKETVAALLTYHIFSQKQPDVVQACTRMFPPPPQNKGSQLCHSTNATFLVIQAQVFTYVAWACPDLTQACLERLHGKAKSLLKTIENSLRKNPMAFGEMCRVLLTLTGMTIREYCDANGKGIPSISSGSVSPPKNPPKGGTGKTTAGFGGIPHNFLSKLTAQLSKTVYDLLENCPAWLKKIVPFCKESQASEIQARAPYVIEEDPLNKALTRHTLSQNSLDSVNKGQAIRKIAMDTVTELLKVPTTKHNINKKTYFLFELFEFLRLHQHAYMNSDETKSKSRMDGNYPKLIEKLKRQKEENKIFQENFNNLIKNLEKINTRDAKQFISSLKKQYTPIPDRLMGKTYPINPETTFGKAIYEVIRLINNPVDPSKNPRKFHTNTVRLMRMLHILHFENQEGEDTCCLDGHDEFWKNAREYTENTNKDRDTVELTHEDYSFIIKEINKLGTPQAYHYELEKIPNSKVTMYRKYLEKIKKNL